MAQNPHSTGWLDEWRVAADQLVALEIAFSRTQALAPADTSPTLAELERAVAHVRENADKLFQRAIDESARGPRREQRVFRAGVSTPMLGFHKPSGD
jgi:aspartyl/asparaginyl beta-hydroxylase (cupin superfamily)